MLGFFKKGGDGRPLTLEQKLEILGRCGLTLAPPFTVADLLESFSRKKFEQAGFDLTLGGLAMTEEQPPWRNHCVNAWHFDTECIEDDGAYARIAMRMAEMTQGSLVLEKVRDRVDLEENVAFLEFDCGGRSVHIDCEVNDDWVDGKVFGHFVKLLGEVNRAKVFICHETGGQGCVIACVLREQFEELKKAGVGFELLENVEI